MIFNLCFQNYFKNSDGATMRDSFKVIVQIISLSEYYLLLFQIVFSLNKSILLLLSSISST